MARTHYEVLGVAEDAAHEEVKRAYRALARATHPDVSRDAKTARDFVRVSQAWEVLGNAAARRTYDRDLESAQGPRGRAASAAAYGDAKSSSGASTASSWNAHHGASAEAGQVNRSAFYMDRESSHYYRAKLKHAKSPADRVRRMQARQTKVASTSSLGVKAVMPIVGISVWMYYAVGFLTQ